MTSFFFFFLVPIKEFKRKASFKRKELTKYFRKLAVHVNLVKYKSLLNNDKNKDHESKLILQVQLLPSGRTLESFAHFLIHRWYLIYCYLIHTRAYSIYYVPGIILRDTKNINSFNSLSSSAKKVLYYLHFTDEETEGPRLNMHHTYFFWGFRYVLVHIYADIYFINMFISYMHIHIHIYCMCKCIASCIFIMLLHTHYDI